MATKTKAPKPPATFTIPARWLPLLRRPTTVYMGPCVLQAPQGWTRCGPMWWTDIGAIIVGPGVARWGTTLGIAELATRSTPSPTMYAAGWSHCSEPNLSVAVEEEALNCPHMELVKAYAAQADELFPS